MPTLKSLARSWHMSGECPKINSVNETCRHRKNPKINKLGSNIWVIFGDISNRTSRSKQNITGRRGSTRSCQLTRQKPTVITDSMTTWGVIMVEYLRRSSAKRMPRSLKWWKECSFHINVEYNKPSWVNCLWEGASMLLHGHCQIYLCCHAWGLTEYWFPSMKSIFVVFISNRW